MNKLYKRIEIILSKYSSSCSRNEYKFISAIFLITFTIKAIFVLINSSGPSVLNDEYLYKFNAESMFHLQKYANAHYPPAYSLTLAPALFFDHWYEAMLVINAFLSSLLVPATWSLAKTVGARHPLVPTTISALIPFHAVYPSFLLSENLFVPLFCCALALCLQGHSTSPSKGVLFGMTMGLGHLTKYLFLPAAPVLYLGWLWGVRNGQQDRGMGRRWLTALVPILPYFTVIALWLWYGHSSGFHWRQLFGLDISAAGRLVTDSGNAMRSIGQFASLSSLLMWIAAYASYLILLWLPAVGIGATWTIDRLFSRRQSKFRHTQMSFLVIAACLVCGYGLIAALHSFGGEYNYPLPNRILGRYLVHLSPIMLLLACFGLDSLSDRQNAKCGLLLTFGAAVTLTFGLTAWSVIKGDIWQFPSFFHKNQLNLLNIATIEPAMYFLLALMAALLPACITRTTRWHHNALATPLAAFFLCSTLTYAWSAPYRQEGLNVRMAASAVDTPAFHGKEVLVLVDKIPVPARGFSESTRFWGITDTTLLQIRDHDSLLRFRSGQLPSILLTSKNLNLPCLKSYSYKQKEYKIFYVEQKNIAKLDFILSEYERLIIQEKSYEDL